MPILLNNERECRNCEYWDGGICDLRGWLQESDDTCEKWELARWKANSVPPSDR